MGIDFASARQLIKLRELVSEKTNGLMLGRQGLHIKPRFFKRLQNSLSEAGLPIDLEQYRQEDGFAETFLKRIGFPEMRSMDASEYEGAEYCQDLNEPVQLDLYKRFDVILDGGTLEHVFNVPQALDNVFHMLTNGGIFISINGITGWAGHGFYQFSPELVWRYWKDTRRCSVKACDVISADSRQPTIHVSDTGKAGRRFRGKGLQGRWYLYYVVQKSNHANDVEKIQNIQQGDYALRWDNLTNSTTKEF